MKQHFDDYNCAFIQKIPITHVTVHMDNNKKFSYLRRVQIHIHVDRKEELRQMFIER